MMEDRYSMEYLLSSATDSLRDEDYLWDADLYSVYRRIIFKSFENYLREQDKDG